MVGTATAEPTIGVSDLEKATGFYGGVLGLHVDHETPYEIIYNSGDSKVAIYQTEQAGTNKATYVTWEVDDIDKEVAELRNRGVQFERYDELAEVILDGNIHVLGEERAAWFKDPDGNILCLHQ